MKPTITRVYATDDEREAERHPALAGFDDFVGGVALQALLRYGVEPLDREVAAAHEAGHVVVALAIGHITRVVRLIVRRASVEEACIPRVAWLGCTYSPEDEVTLFRAAARAGDRWAIVRDATFTLAGLAGEAAIGRAHQSSSVEERLRAQLGCQAVALLENGATPDQVFATPGNTAWLECTDKPAVMDLMRKIYCACAVTADEAIAANRKPFDRLRHKLMTHERLGWPEIAPLVEDIRHVPVGVK